MDQVEGWVAIGVVLSAIPVLLITGLRQMLSRKPVEEKYRGMSSGGLVGVFDAVWSPSAHEASMDRDRQQRASIPAPTPDKGPGRMDAQGRIVIEIDGP
jgi:hypothetical protein